MKGLMILVMALVFAPYADAQCGPGGCVSVRAGGVSAYAGHHVATRYSVASCVRARQAARRTTRYNNRYARYATPSVSTSYGSAGGVSTSYGSAGGVSTSYARYATPSVSTSYGSAGGVSTSYGSAGGGYNQPAKVSTPTPDGEAFTPIIPDSDEVETRQTMSSGVPLRADTLAAE